MATMFCKVGSVRVRLNSPSRDELFYTLGDAKFVFSTTFSFGSLSNPKTRRVAYRRLDKTLGRQSRGR